MECLPRNSIATYCTHNKGGNRTFMRSVSFTRQLYTSRIAVCIHSGA